MKFHVRTCTFSTTLNMRRTQRLHTSLEIQEKPPVAKVKVRVISILMHQIENLCVQNLNQRPAINQQCLESSIKLSVPRIPHVGEMGVHGAALREIGNHPLHQLAKTRVSECLVVHDNEQGSH